jgi:hypothetical protein
MPVVTPPFASMEMVKAVPNREELSWAMGARRNAFAFSSVRERHIRPRPWGAMKLTASVVTWSAARVRSPSFSRSSSSTRITILAARICSWAASIADSGTASPSLEFIVTSDSFSSCRNGN